jgi:Gpi18-like mannosyltransferase
MKSIIENIISYWGGERKNVYSFVFLFLIMFLIVPMHYHADLRLFMQWGLHNYHKGLSQIYVNSGTDYMPITHYILYLFMAVQADLARLEPHTLPLFKLIFTAVEFVFAVSLLHFLKIKKDWLFYFIFIVLNPAFFYNSYVWGQVDSLYTFMVVISLFLAYKRRIPASYAMMTFAILCKYQAIFYIPILGLITLPHFISKPMQILWSLLMIMTVILVFTFPLEDPTAILDVMKNSVDMYPFPTTNAFNIWFLLEDKKALLEIGTLKDTNAFWGLTYKTYGYIFFFTASFFALLPMLNRTLINIKNKTYEISYELIALSGALVALSFFYFLTQMHERYCHAAIFFIIIYCFSKRKYWIYGLFSYAYFANMERILNFFHFENLGTVPFQPITISLAFGVSLILLYKDLYQNHFQEKFVLTKKSI